MGPESPPPPLLLPLELPLEPPLELPLLPPLLPPLLLVLPASVGFEFEELEHAPAAPTALITERMDKIRIVFIWKSLPQTTRRAP
jgi:hypothetical protein